MVYLKQLTMKDTKLFWQKATAIALIACAFIASLMFTSCENPQPRFPSVADEIIHYSGNYEMINDSIAVLKGDGTTHRDFIYKKNVNGRWRRVM